VTAAPVNQPGWDDEEKELRRTEVRTGRDNVRIQKLMARVQAAALALALVASLAAAYAAYQAGQAVKASEQGALQQATEAQLTTAIDAIGGVTTAEQVAGVTLLRVNIAGQVQGALRTSDLLVRQTAFDAYATSLDVLAAYIRSGTSSETSASPSFGPGYGIPKTQQPLGVVYATDELRLLLGMGGAVKSIASADMPAVDLSHDELYGLPWSKLSIGWLSSAYMLKVDLRSADLAASRWSRSSFLVGAFLQCADLSGADFRGADLAGADLRGANVSGADFTGANLRGARTDGAFGSAKGLNAVDAASVWNQPGCASNRDYWDLP